MESPGSVWRRIPISAQSARGSSTQVIKKIHTIDESKQNFVLECACNDPDNCPIGDCECDGQVRINHDCTLAK